MNYLNIHTDFLRSETYLGAEPIERATWLNLMAWCASQENGGVIENAESWTDRKWQQLCGITLSEVKTTSSLYSFKDGNLVVSNYPLDKELEVKAKREAGKKGGRPKKVSASEHLKNKGIKPHGLDLLKARDNHQAETVKTERKGREGKEKKIKESPAAPPLPHGEEFARAWASWKKHRSELKKPLKPTMVEAQLKKLGSMPEAEAVEMMLHTVTMGWQGLRAPEQLKTKSSRFDASQSENQHKSCI